MIKKEEKLDTLEQRIMKSNLSDDDKIELIKKLNQLVIYNYPCSRPADPLIYTYEVSC